MVKTAILTGMLLACLCGAAPAASEAEQQFLFLELQRAEREHGPNAPRPADLLFGLGEYHFRVKNWPKAEQYFRIVDGASPDGAMGLLTKVYLAEIARSSGRDAAPPEIAELKRRLSERHFLSVFGESGLERWTSRLKNDYELREHVDRLEVYLNGSLFYTVRLP